VARVSGPALWTGVVLLGGLGAVFRFAVDALVALRVAGRMPLGTLVVNLTGALALGVLVGAAAGRGLSLLLGAAFIGSYTTFSTWMWESLLLAEDRQSGAALLNVLGQAGLGLAAAAAGWAIGAAG
jgi:CrcB protein